MKKTKLNNSTEIYVIWLDSTTLQYNLIITLEINYWYCALRRKVNSDFGDTFILSTESVVALARWMR